VRFRLAVRGVARRGSGSPQGAPLVPLVALLKQANVQDAEAEAVMQRWLPTADQTGPCVCP
jgi:hypothetical protein